MTRIRYITLDIGNTLYYDEEDKLGPLRKTLEKLGLVYEQPPPTPGKLLSMHGIPLNEVCEVSLEAAAALYVSLAGEKPAPRRVREVYEALVERVAAIAVLYPGAKSVVEQLYQEGYKLAIISNASSHEKVLRILERDGLMDYFEIIVTSRLVGLKKPHPGIFKYTLVALGASPEESLHVGDRAYEDVQGAKNIGMRAVQIVKNIEEASQQADAVIDNISKLPATISMLNKASQDY